MSIEAEMRTTFRTIMFQPMFEEWSRPKQLQGPARPRLMLRTTSAENNSRSRHETAAAAREVAGKSNAPATPNSNAASELTAGLSRGLSSKVSINRSVLRAFKSFPIAAAPYTTTRLSRRSTSNVATCTPQGRSEQALSALPTGALGALGDGAVIDFGHRRCTATCRLIWRRLRSSPSGIVYLDLRRR